MQPPPGICACYATVVKGYINGELVGYRVEEARNINDEVYLESSINTSLDLSLEDSGDGY